MIPIFEAPPEHRYIGPVLWSPQVPLPAWWDTIPTDRPIIYMTLGSSGDMATLPTIVAALAALPVTVLVATAGRRTLEALPPNVFVADYLPGLAASARAGARQ
jgi:UDP:flavonoid glycosyltransferase YjiC (YdhE family)